MQRTMPQDQLHPEIIKAIPGTVGAIVALRWISGPPLQRIFSLIGGIGASYYGSGYVAKMMGGDAGLAGFMIGLFGMAAASKVFDGLAALNPKEFIDRVLRKFGL